MAASHDTRLKTVWIWPAGMFPRRVIYWLKAKSLPLSVLHSDTNKSGELNFQMSVLDMRRGGLVPAGPDIEERPPGYSFPTLRVAGEERPVTQSSALMEYLEECYPASEGFNDLIGGTISPEVRAYVRAIVQLVTESSVWLGVDARHTDERTLTWSGMSKEQMSLPAGEDARKQYHNLFSKLENWVRVDIKDRKTLSLAGVQGMPTLADFSLAAMAAYTKESYGIDILEGHDVLKEWFDRYSSSRFFVTREEIDQVEREGFETLFAKS